MKCKQCGIEFESKRSTATYCSAKCRKLAFLNPAPLSVPRAGPGVSVPDLSVADVPVKVSGTSGLKDYVESQGEAYRGALEDSVLTQHERQRESNNESRPVKHTVNTGAWKSFGELGKGEVNRVSLPGDSDYVGAVGELQVAGNLEEMLV